MPLINPPVFRRRPFIENGNFVNGLDGWAANGAVDISLVSTPVKFDGYAIHVEPTEQDQAGIVHAFETILPSTSYLTEAYVRGTGSVQLLAAEYNASDEFLNGNSSGELVMSPTEWRIVSRSIVSAATAAKMRVYVVAWGAQANIDFYLGGVLRRNG